MTESDSKSNQSTQLNRFKEAARTIGCDESEAAFDGKLAEVAKHKPAPTPEPEKK